MKKKTIDFMQKQMNVTIVLLLLMIFLFLLIVMFIGNKSYNPIIIVIFSLWLISVINYLFDFRRNFVIVLFLGSYFTFIISRPFISCIKGDIWWYFESGAIEKALIAIYCSLCFILIGDRIYKCIKTYKDDKNNKKREYRVKGNSILDFNCNQKILAILFLIIVVFGLVNLYVEVENYLFLHKLNYEVVYTSVAPDHNIIIRLLSSLYIYVSILYLALKPNKKMTYLILLLFIITGIPSFLLGSRNVLVLRIVFSVSYILIRDIIGKNGRKEKEIWISKKMKYATLIIIPALVIFMGAYNYIRDGKKVSLSFTDLIVDTFYKQGTTFDTISQGFEYENRLKEYNQLSYTFGDIIDYISHNTISQKVFGTEPFPNGNSMIVVREGNSLAHRLSYYVLGKESYLSGHGRGTSYILETYMDGSYIWLSLYSLILGFYMSSIVDLLTKKKIFLSFFVLMSIYELFLLPRYSGSGFISFIVKPYYWCALLIVLFLTKFMNIIINKRQTRNE